MPATLIKPKKSVETASKSIEVVPKETTSNRT